MTTTDGAELDARELHAIARAGDGEPAAFVVARARVERLERELGQARAQRDALVREARELGVSYVALERWTGLGARHLHRIVGGE